MKKIYSFFPRGLVVFFFAICQLVMAQERSISGKVTSETGEGLPGASVSVKGTTIGSTTTADGKFVLTIPADAKVLFASYIGYQILEIPIGNQTVFDIKLQPDISSLSEVIVVGYGTQKTKEVTGSITSVTADDFNRGVVRSPDQLLAGKVAGLTITRQGGDPNRKPSILLRGPSTLSGSTEPFYVIDNVPGASIDLIAPEDIISMDVAKDAASTAIYGTRAANGVIFVTTKRGKAGQSTLSYSTYVGMEQVSKQLDVATGAELREYLKSKNQTLAPSDNDGSDTDWQKEISRIAWSQNHNLSFGGGNEKTSFQASLTYFNQPGVVKTSDFSRLLGRLSVDFTGLHDRLNLNMSIANNFEKSSLIPYQVFYQAARFMPTVGVYAADGTFRIGTRQQSDNPVALLEQNKADNKRSTFLGSTQARLKLIEGLTYNLNLSYQTANNLSGYFMTTDSEIAANLDGSFKKGFAKRISSTNSTQILETYFDYTKTFDKHSVKGLLGYSYQSESLNDGVAASSNNFLSNDLGYNGLFLGNPPNGYIYTADYPELREAKLISFYSRLNYTFDDRYSLQLSVRRDGSSRFGANNKWKYFPTVSATWNIESESFMQNQRLFDQLKIRAGYGVAGSQNLAPYQSLNRFSSSGFGYYLDQWIYSFYYKQIANPDLRWETTSSLNIGTDFAILNNRITGTVDWYSKQTTDMLDSYTIPVPPYPVNNYFANAGQMSNKGIEVAISVDVLRASAVKWKTSFNMAHNKNEVKSLSNDELKKEFEQVGVPGGQAIASQFVEIIKPGYPLGTFYLYEYAGKNEKNQALFHAVRNNRDTLLTRGSLKAPDDYRFLGNAFPKYTFGWVNEFSYKSFSFSFFLRGVYGNKIYNGIATNLSNLSEANGYNVLKSAIEDGNTDTPTVSDFFLEDGSFIRLDNATFSYQLPKFLGISRASVYLTGQNLFTITRFSGVDPEVNLTGKAPGIYGISGGNDNPNNSQATYFRTRSVILGLNVSF